MRVAPARAVPSGPPGDNLTDSSDHTRQRYRGLVLDLFVFQLIPPVGKEEWDYEVTVENEDRVRLCGPYVSLSSYGTQRAAEQASVQRARIAADGWLGDI
ncbi:hypothetical protein [Cupriavidus sp. D384]|uniref:hypothetical protein n=1 Tax=Cupriavidus sp. D384 TaxID=1538095 RepID=UPI000AC466CE|nr:hypothetical protein [Cupriavidus sp. D384]